VTTARRAEVIGLGLIGSSLALALSRAGWHVSGSDIDDTREKRALELGVVSELGEDPDAELLVVATPVAQIAEIASRRLASRDDLVVTDVGSVKGPVVASVDHPRFVGGHPMAGSEQEGPDGADPDLFIGASWVLTPAASTDERAFATVREVVAAAGAELVVLSPRDHDALVAVVSHVPHLTAANLMAVAADASTEHAALLRLAAGGFRDMTRIAAGDPGIWPDIFKDNAPAVLEVLDALRARLDEARRIIVEEDREALVDLLEYAKRARRNLPPKAVRPEDLVECRVPVLDRPGVLAEVTAILSRASVNVWDLEIAHSAEGERGVLVLALRADSEDAARAGLQAAGYRPSFRPLS
jgi:prephenate dehydrogenase